MTKNNKAWFTPVRGSYLPKNGIGLLLYGLYCLYLALLVTGWFVDGHRIWYLLVDVIPLTVAAALLMQFVAARHSK
jgi:hypothetical protein